MAIPAKLIGRISEVKETNEFLDLLRAKVYNIQKKKPKMLLEIYQEHNNEVEQLIGSQYSKATLKKYHTSRLHTQAFLKHKYSLNDIDVKQIQYKVITDFEFWLKTKRNCNHNSTIKYLTNFKKIIRICLNNSWL
jgi:hypothetical protein